MARWVLPLVGLPWRPRAGLPRAVRKWGPVQAVSVPQSACFCKGKSASGAVRLFVGCGLALGRPTRPRLWPGFGAGGGRCGNVWHIDHPGHRTFEEEYVMMLERHGMEPDVNEAFG